MIYRFADCILDQARLELRRGGEPVAVEPQVFSLLVHLAAHADRVVDRDELIAVVWDGRIVSEATLSSRINAARRAVGDDGARQAVIRTYPRRGLRLVAPVTADADRPAVPPPIAGGAAVDEGPGPPDQVVRFRRTASGVQLAWAVAGQGPPLVKAANWLNHVELDWRSPIWRALFARLARSRTLYRYDERGTGLSDWRVDDLGFEAFVEDLEEVVAAAGLDRFPLLGISHGGAVAVAYAARHPGTVERLVLWGGLIRGRQRRGDTVQAAQGTALESLILSGWGGTNPAFRRMFAALYLPQATEAQVDWFTDLQRVAVNPENALAIRHAIDQIDVSDLLPAVTCPVLIVHSRDEAVVPLDEARRAASLLPQAEVLVLDSANHVVLPQEPAWETAVARIEQFLAGT